MSIMYVLSSQHKEARDATQNEPQSLLGLQKFPINNLKRRHVFDHIICPLHHFIDWPIFHDPSHSAQLPDQIHY